MDERLAACGLPGLESIVPVIDGGVSPNNEGVNSVQHWQGHCSINISEIALCKEVGEIAYRVKM
jgi:hypothetical protein